MDEQLVGITAEGPPARSAFRLLCTPSWLSCVLCIIITLAVVGGMVGITKYHGSAVQEEFLAWRNRPASVAPGEQADYTVTSVQSVTDTIFTFVLWAFIGLFCYYAAFGIYEAFHAAESLKEELHYVHVDRRQLLREALIRIGIRLAVLIAWSGYIVLFFIIIVPQSLTMAHAAASQPMSLRGIAAVLDSMLILFAALHLHVVLLRLLLLKPRVFHS